MRARLLMCMAFAAFFLCTAIAFAQDPFDGGISIPLDYGRLITTLGEQNASVQGWIFDWMTSPDSILRISDATFPDGYQCGEDRDFASADFNDDGMDEIVYAWSRADGGVFVGIPTHDLVSLEPVLWNTPDSPIPGGVLYASDTLADILGEIRVVAGNFYAEGGDEFVLAYLAADSTVTITVFDVDPGNLVPEARGSISDQAIYTEMPEIQRFGTASRFDIAVGDLDNDGTDEIILVASDPDNAPEIDLWINVYDYDPGTHTIIPNLQTNLSMANPLPGPPYDCLRRVVAVSGNFDADPQDEVAIMHDWAPNDDYGEDTYHASGCQIVGFDTDITTLSERWEFPIDYYSGDGVAVWSPVTSLNHNVRALTVYKGNLIAGGTFWATFDGTTAVSGVARWDGSAWRPLGVGMDNFVNALTVYNGDLIAGGGFTKVFNTYDGDSIIANRIARWDGGKWNPLGTGVDNPVRALTVYNGDLIVGGDFGGTSGGGLTSPGIIRWNGTQWQAMTTSIQNSVHALADYHDTLFVGGEFNSINGTSRYKIACWDGTDWFNPPLVGANATVRAMAVYNDDLYIGGDFTEACAIPAGGIIRLNDGVWEMPGSGFNNPVYSLGTFNFGTHGEVIVAGGDMYYLDQDGRRYWRLAWFSDLEGNWKYFHSPGGGANQRVSALAEYNGDLILGGEFTYVHNGATTIDTRGIGRVKPEGDGVLDSLRARCDFPIDIVAKDIDHEPDSPDELIMLFYSSREIGLKKPYHAIAVAGLNSTFSGIETRGYANVGEFNYGIDGLFGSRHVLGVADITGDDLAGDGIEPDEAIVLVNDTSTVHIKAYELHPDTLTLSSDQAPLIGDWKMYYTNELTELITANLDTATIELRAPTYYNVDSIIQPLVILNVPPVHYDILDDTTWDVSNRYPWPPDGDYETYCAYGNRQDWVTSVQSEIRKDWGISAGLQTNFSSCGATVKAHLNTEYGEGFSVQGENTTTLSVIQAIEAQSEDMVLAASIDYDVWEYPVYRRGERLVGADVVVVNPSEVRKVWYTGKEIENWISDHEVENIFSYARYPDLADNPMVASEGVIQGFTWQMAPSTQGYFALRKEEFESSTVEESNHFGMEVGASIGYEGGLSFFGLGATWGVEVSVEGTYNSSELNTYTTTFTTADSLHVQYGYLNSSGSFEGNRKYEITPYAYWSKNGSLVLDYAAGPITNPEGEDPTWWQIHYSDPDPAFILPWRLDPEKDGSSPGENRYKTREVVFVPNNPSPGDTVLIIARVHNFSLNPTLDPVKVSFYLGDPDNFGQLLYDKNTGDSLFWGCDIDGFPSVIQSQGEVAAQMVWQVPAEGDITECQRIWALIDPLDEISSEVHDNDAEISNNKGWNRLDVNTATECLDRDGDGWEESAFRCCGAMSQWDNCPDVYNPDQTDTDGDGIGDACEEFVIVCGDANGDGTVNVGDAVFLISYIFKGGPAPDPVCAGDANGDAATNVGDAVYLIAYIFKSGPPPVDGCCY